MAGDHQVKVRGVATGDQAEVGAGAPGRGGHRRAAGQVHRVVVARRVMAVDAEPATVGVHHHLVQLQQAFTGVESAPYLVHLHERAVGADHPQVVDPDRPGLQRQRQRPDVRQRVRPGGQLERLVVLDCRRQRKHRVFHVQHVQPQQPPGQRQEGRVDGDPLRGEHQHPVLVALAVGHRLTAGVVGTGHLHEAHVVQAQRPRSRALGGAPLQGGAGRQPGGDLREQEVAPAEGHQQPVRAEHHQHRQHQAGDARAGRQPAPARLAALA